MSACLAVLVYMSLLLPGLPRLTHGVKEKDILCRLWAALDGRQGAFSVLAAHLLSVDDVVISLAIKAVAAVVVTGQVSIA